MLGTLKSRQPNAAMAEIGSRNAEYTYDIFKKVAAADGTLTRAQMETLLEERKRQTKVTADVPLIRFTTQPGSGNQSNFRRAGSADAHSS